MASLIRRNFLVLALAGTASLVAPCRAATSGEDEGEEREQARLLAWLRKAGPADWHRCACTWNWDQPFDAIRWIIRQRHCDAGTAVTLFARGEPGYYSKYASLAEIEAKAGWAMETVHFLAEICERWQAGQYSAWRFRPDQLPNLTETLPWPVPATLARAGDKGVALDFTGWNEGFPPGLRRG
jgi:hypothetical protein